MKYFKCGSCQAPYKIDESIIKSVQVTVECPKCGVKNIIRLGPLLVVQSKNNIHQFPLKLGQNLLGRKSNKSSADLQIEDEYVSRTHLAVYLEEKEQKLFVSIEDMDSLNGTFNSNKVRLKKKQKYPLGKNEYVIIGLSKISLKFN